MFYDLCQGVLLEPPELIVLCSDSPHSGHPIRLKTLLVLVWCYINGLCSGTRRVMPLRFAFRTTVVNRNGVTIALSLLDSEEGTLTKIGNVHFDLFAFHTDKFGGFFCGDRQINEFAF